MIFDASRHTARDSTRTNRTRTTRTFFFLFFVPSICQKSPPCKKRTGNKNNKISSHNTDQLILSVIRRDFTHTRLHRTMVLDYRNCTRLYRGYRQWQCDTGQPATRISSMSCYTFFHDNCGDDVTFHYYSSGTGNSINVLRSPPRWSKGGSSHDQKAYLIEKKKKKMFDGGRAKNFHVSRITIIVNLFLILMKIQLKR